MAIKRGRSDPWRGGIGTPHAAHDRPRTRVQKGSFQEGEPRRKAKHAHVRAPGNLGHHPQRRRCDKIVGMIPARLIQYLYSAIFIIAFPSILSPTTIVGIWTPKQITIVADSKQTMVQNNQIVGSQTACKVFVVRNIAVGLAGLAQAEQVSVADSIKNSHELVEQGTNAKLPEASIVVAAESSVTQVLRHRNAAYDPNVPISLIFGGMINGKLQMFKVEMSGMQIAGDFAMPARTRRIAFPESRGYDGTDPNRAIEVIGISDTVKRFQKLLPMWNEGDDVAVGRRLVAIEASDGVASAFVGGPITTVVINKKGLHWIDAGACQ